MKMLGKLSHKQRAEHGDQYWEGREESLAKEDKISEGRKESGRELWHSRVVWC